MLRAAKTTRDPACYGETEGLTYITPVTDEEGRQGWREGGGEVEAVGFGGTDGGGTKRTSVENGCLLVEQ